MLLVGNGDGKPEYYCLGEKMVVDSSGVVLCGSGEGYPLVESLGSEYGAYLGSPGGRVSGEEYEGHRLCPPSVFHQYYH